MAHGLLHQNMLKEIAAKEPLEDQEVLQNAPRSGGVVTWLCYFCNESLEAFWIGINNRNFCQ